ncbi:MAG: CoA transferase subunit B [Bdellovibrionales bacterium]|nr:CoA transferase subunit B [Bdellovibrionales bacterium]
MKILTRDQICARAAQEIKAGFVVNLGIGIPTLVANHIPSHLNIMLHSENGVMGVGPFPLEEEVDPDLINAGKQTISTLPGASFFNSSDSFAMIRGGHIDLTILGSMQVDETGSLANWMVPGKLVKGMGGAMDLVSGAKRVVLTMQHLDKNGSKKLLRKCTLPLTGSHCVHRIITDMAVIDITQKGFLLKEVAPGLTPEIIANNTEAPLQFDPDITEMKL